MLASPPRDVLVVVVVVETSRDVRTVTTIPSQNPNPYPTTSTDWKGVTKSGPQEVQLER